MKLFKPKMYQKDIFHIDYSFLQKKGIKLLIFDIDNTLVVAKKMEKNERVKSFLSRLQKDFIVVIASNNFKRRVQKISHYLGCDYFSFIMKPTKKIAWKIKKNYHCKASDACIIGDQIMTDILVGNRLGMFSILVDPISNEDLPITKLNRYLEKKVMKKNLIKRGDYYEEK